MSAEQADRVIASKLANAMVANVDISQLTKDVIDVLPRARHVRRTLDAFMQHCGGNVWVGGTATLTEQQLAFRPNVVNRLIQDGALEIAIPLETITGVTLEGGFLTKIIAVATPVATMRIRCFGAAGFAKQIRDAAPCAAA